MLGATNDEINHVTVKAKEIAHATVERSAKGKQIEDHHSKEVVVPNVQCLYCSPIPGTFKKCDKPNC
jgi:hypothetical protein